MLTGEDKKLYQLSEKFSYVKTFLVATKGFEKKDLKRLQTLQKELSSNPKISINNQLNNKKFQKFKQKYTFYLNDLSYENSFNINIGQSYEEIIK